MPAPMLLVIDVGNTNIVVGVFDATGWSPIPAPHRRASHRGRARPHHHRAPQAQRTTSAPSARWPWLTCSHRWRGAVDEMSRLYFHCTPAGGHRHPHRDQHQVRGPAPGRRRPHRQRRGRPPPLRSPRHPRRLRHGTTFDVLSAAGEFLRGATAPGHPHQPRRAGEPGLQAQPFRAGRAGLGDRRSPAASMQSGSLR